ncbi:hypothetical protein [Desulfococcus sp.]|uniref:hypothetical protein n=1 Tax=Desulfococcus sp. TaxID=2025834 RepID=UPI0035932EF0
MKTTGVFLLTLLAGSFPAAAAHVNPGGDTDVQCAECHEAASADHGASVHRAVGCLECHPGAETPEHEAAPPIDCRECHAPHDEKVIHDAHSRVDCRACHVKGGVAARDPRSGRIVWSGDFRPGPAPGPHQAIRTGGEDVCGTCHFRGNAMGAVSTVLPPKSVLCMPCHVATVSAGDTVTLVALVVFLLGAAGLGAVWAAAIPGREGAPLGGRILPMIRSAAGAFLRGGFSRILNTLIVEVFLMRRLFRLSRVRWLIHALIVYPMAFRFAFGIAALALSILLPDLPVTRAMLDKNSAVRAFTFDLTGAMMLAGAAGAVVRERKAGIEGLTGLPEPGRGMPLLIGLIVLVGFVLEGLRIAMTGMPEGAAWAFFGVAASLLFKGMTGLTTIYGYGWYLHAILVGGFAALIPFTHMSHIITAPISLILDARHPTSGHSR